MTLDLEAIYEDYEAIGELSDELKRWSLKQPEAQVIHDIIKGLKPKKIVAVGLFKGVSTLVMLQALEGQDYEYILGIDPFFKGQFNIVLPWEDIEVQKDQENYYDVYKKVTSKYGDKVKTVRGFATVAGNESSNLDDKEEVLGNREDWFKLREVEEGVDLIFLDGDHTYPTCLEDFKVAWDKIRVGGVVLLHDVYSWVDEIDKALPYIRALPNAELELIGEKLEDGIGVVTKI